MAEEKIAIGIDLVTTYSCVGVSKNNNVEIVSNDQGYKTTPSYVAFTEKERLVGVAAKLQSAMNSKNTVFDFFDNVMVNDEDKAIKKNRLELLQMLCKTYENYLNFSNIETL